MYFVLFLVDVVEIGDTRSKIGEILKVKPLGALAMIDEGELDWKIIAISLDDPKASLVNDVNDVEKHFPVWCFHSHFLVEFKKTKTMPSSKKMVHDLRHFMRN